MALATGLVWHELLMWHDTSALADFMSAGRGVIEPDIPAESPASKRRIKNLLDAAGLTEQLAIVKPRPATEAELMRVHASEYIAEILRMSAGNGGDASLGRIAAVTPFGPGGYDIAALAVGGVLEAVDAVATRRLANAYALVRPPGHHAERDFGFGFCIFNNVALAARHAQVAHGLQRIAILDWDVHHGNGAERIFWEDPDVLTMSIHQDNCYPPRSGAIDAIGGGRGEGCNLNIPLPPGCGTGAYLAAIDRVVLPALERFRPDMILIASGLDAGAYDPQGRMMLHGGAFAEMTRKLMAAADELCAGRLLMTHEGGYHRTSVPFHALGIIEALSGLKGTIEDPFAPLVSGIAYQDLQPHQDAVIRSAEMLLDRL